VTVNAGVVVQWDRRVVGRGAGCIAAGQLALYLSTANARPLGSKGLESSREGLDWPDRGTVGGAGDRDTR
jgi:hypothetical protein